MYMLLYICMYVCMYVCVYIYIYIYIYICCIIIILYKFDMGRVNVDVANVMQITTSYVQK